MKINIFSLFLLMSLVVLGAACQKETKPEIDGEKVRDYANALYNRQLYHQSIQEYEYYLQNYDIGAAEQANINYIIGDIYFERLRDYENALACYLKIKHLYPESPLVEEANKKIVESLERLQRSADAQQALDETTMLDESQVRQKRPGEVIATIGKREITMGDLEYEINQLPPYIRSQISNKSKKVEFLKQYIATELFYDSAKRQGLDKDKEVLDAAFQAKKNFMVQKFLEEEISQKLNINESDIDLYYKAHKDDYAKKDDNGNIVTEQPLAEVKDRVMKDLVKDKQKEAYEQLLQRMMRAEAVEIYEDKLQ